MARNMREWKEGVIRSPRKKGAPVLSFPVVQLMGISVRELISSSQLQAEGMKRIADRCPSLASLSMMDLTVEAEAFGAQVQVPDNDVPTTIGELICSEEDAARLQVPSVDVGRTGVYIDAMARACELIQDRPVFAGIIGPFTLAGRLIGLMPILKGLRRKKEMIHTVLKKGTEFIIAYAQAYKERTGANGFVMAEPMAGLLSPAMAEEFAEPYVRQIIEAVQDEHFIVIYHNCGDSAVMQADSIARLGAEGYHFGNIIDMGDILPKMPADSLVMGNINPAEYFCLGTPDQMEEQVRSLLNQCGQYPNFIISSGCDIAPVANWDCIDRFFSTVENHYAGL